MSTYSINYTSYSYIQYTRLLSPTRIYLNNEKILNIGKLGDSTYIRLNHKCCETLDLYR